MRINEELALLINGKPIFLSDHINISVTFPSFGEILKLMPAIKGKEVRKTIENSLLQSLKSLEVSKPTKKAMKVIRKASKEIGNKLKRELKGKKS